MIGYYEISIGAVLNHPQGSDTYQYCFHFKWKLVYVYPNLKFSFDKMNYHILKEWLNPLTL